MKKVLSLVLSICMLFSICTGLTFTAQAAEPKTEYTYSIRVLTTDDADGWNAAYLRLEDTTADVRPYKEWDIQSSIDDSGEAFTTTFSDTRFYDRILVYVSFGGGLTWHDWAGRITASVNGIPQIEENVSASSSIGSPASENFEYFLDMPYPVSADVYARDADGDKDYDLAFRQGENTADASGNLYLSLVDQYNTYWNNWKDFSILSNNDVYSVYETNPTETRIRAKSSLGEDHTDTVSLHGVTYNTEHETFDNSFNVKFAFWHKVTAAAAEHGTVTASVDKAYTGDTVTLTPFAEDGYALESVSVTDENGNDIAVTDNKFTMPGSDVTVNATFAPTTYIARFVADGKTVAEIPYTVNTTEIDEPDVPVKPGYTGAWKPYTLGIGGITVEAEYKQVIHDFRVSSSTPATCTSEGYDTYTCVYCGETYNKTTTPALGHTYKVILSTPATCTEEGVDTYECSVCGDTYTKKTPVIAHNYKVTDTVAATCDTEGYETYTCSVCGDTYNKATTPTKGHQFVVTTHKDATCTEDGYQIYKCLDCNETYTGDYTPAKGHNYVAETVAPTCYDEGYTTYTCDVCGETRKKNGEVYKTNITKPVPHVMNNAYTEYPTCNEFGQKVSICINCGYIESDILSPTGDHKYNAVITKKATCKEKGVVTYTCESCASSYTEEISPIGHDWKAEWNKNKTYHWHACMRCKEKLDKAEHTYGKSGDARFTCTICGYVNKTKKKEAKAADKAASEKASASIVAGLKGTTDGKTVNVKWGKVKGADRYAIYATYCGYDTFIRLRTVKGTSYNVMAPDGNKLDPNKDLKVYIVAEKKVDGEYTELCDSPIIHIAGKKSKNTNVKKINVKKNNFTLKVNKTAKIKPSLVLENKNKKLIDHVAKYRYVSSNKAVATVDKNGKIKAVGKGTAIIYVYGANGVAKAVKVTVK